MVWAVGQCVSPIANARLAPAPCRTPHWSSPASPAPSRGLCRSSPRGRRTAGPSRPSVQSGLVPSRFGSRPADPTACIWERDARHTGLARRPARGGSHRPDRARSFAPGVRRGAGFTPFEPLSRGSKGRFGSCCRPQSPILAIFDKSCQR